MCVCMCMQTVSVCACACVCMYLGVEALSILGDSVELWETQHVLLAARSVKYPQSERRQCSKYLHHTDDRAACIHFDSLDNQCSYQQWHKRNFIKF